MTTRLQLSLSAKGLKNLSGFMEKSDPFAVVTVRGDNPDNRPEVVGRTDVYVIFIREACERVFCHLKFYPDLLWIGVSHLCPPLLCLNPEAALFQLWER